ncbi:AraC family transcriptional regulator [Nonomuraea sp. NN258]|uniref:AraC family transcriptional regulator n=1 Tax=Nonomuraea antri TaxID=2730852 RepID=UPI0015694D79|nr:AraC family transcriptional regulator [Nonomuraea antri]NRQ31213.1 AraC family transcriptional regulator [Nonomuraea antri]
MSDPSTANALDCVLLPRLVITASGLDPARVAGQADIPAWALRTNHATVASDRYLRIWELVEHELGSPYAAVAIVRNYRVGALGLYDYLFITASTLWEGFEISGTFMPTVSTNWHFQYASETERDITFHVNLNNGEGRGAELAMQFGLMGTFTRARAVTGRPVNPVRVSFRQAAPRRRDAFVDVLGTDDVHFGAPADAVTVRKADMNLPVLGFDPMLASILRRHADALPRPPAATTWLDRFRQVLRESLGSGSSLTQVAARLAMSPRTLQRRLADLGTGWRHELDGVRRAEAARMKAAGRAALAHRLGYSDARSLARANQRWKHRGVATPGDEEVAEDVENGPVAPSQGWRHGRRG